MAKNTFGKSKEKNFLTQLGLYPFQAENVPASFHLNCHQSGWKKFPGNSSKGKSSEVPFHGITLPYSYFEVI